MRSIKAGGGWCVVRTEEVEIHHSSDLSPYFEGRLWSEFWRWWRAGRRKTPIPAPDGRRQKRDHCD
jgi:hypothetical protein